MTLLLILTVSFLTHIPFLLSGGFLSDESIYTYAAYAIDNGVVPYQQIALPHPPVGYLGIAGLLFLAKGNLLVLRASYLLLFLVMAVLSYWLYEILRRSANSGVSPHLAVAVLTLFPMAYALTTPLEFIIFEIPLVLSIILFATGLILESGRRLVLSGVCVGTAVMTWYPAIFVAISLLGFMIVYILRRPNRPPRRALLASVAAFFVGGSIAISSVLGTIIALGGVENFFLQSVTLQSSLRDAFTLDQRIRHIGLSVQEFLPLYVLTGAGAIELIRRTRGSNNPLILLPLWILVSNFVFLSTIPKLVLNHYFAYLTPFLAYLASGGLAKLFQVFSSVGKNRIPPRAANLYVSTITIAIILIIVAVPLYRFPSYGVGFFDNNHYTAAEQTVGQFVMELTSSSDLIWTSEGGIAFFASRLIQAPDSSDWPIQAAYHDIFNATYFDADGVQHTGLGLVSPSQFVSSWQNHRTKVLVFIVGEGPVPYPDEFLWYGFAGTNGVEFWVKQNYSLVSTFGFQELDYQYSVWLRKE